MPLGGTGIPGAALVPVLDVAGLWANASCRRKRIGRSEARRYAEDAGLLCLEGLREANWKWSYQEFKTELNRLINTPTEKERRDAENLRKLQREARKGPERRAPAAEMSLQVQEDLCEGVNYYFTSVRRTGLAVRNFYYQLFTGDPSELADDFHAKASRSLRKEMILEARDRASAHRPGSPEREKWQAIQEYYSTGKKGLSKVPRATRLLLEYVGAAGRGVRARTPKTRRSRGTSGSAAMRSIARRSSC